MAKRRQKTRTHRKVSKEELEKIPRSMVLRLGSSLKNHSLSQLVKDFRSLMQPHTAINLRERKSNKLKDFIVMAGPLGVSHLFVFNQSASGNVSMRIGRMPRGPSLQFKINSYSLVKDIRKFLKHPKSVGKDSKEFLNPPLLVLNGFSSKLTEADNHEKLLITIFQGMFPPIQPQSTNVNSIKRVLMINKDPQTGDLDLRHYAIDTKLVEENRNVKRIVKSHHDLKKDLPNLANNQDISELILDPYSAGGATSDSEVEGDAIVEVQSEDSQPLKKRRLNTEEDIESDSSSRKKAIKLTELGPRINMTLMKIEEGLTGSSKTLYHRVIKKSKAEESDLQRKHQEKERQKNERRAAQKTNVDTKNAKKEAKKERKKGKDHKVVFEHENGSDTRDQSSEDEINDTSEIDPDVYENDSDLYSDIEKLDA